MTVVHATFGAVERNAKESGGEIQKLPDEVVARASFNACLSEAARHSGMDDQDIADEMHISHGYMSKFMRSVSAKWARRLVAFMRTTNSYAPLQWMANQMGCDIVPRSSQLTDRRAA